MNRRDFLKAIGLGTASLALPRPLRVVAAKAADLQKPPLHVGYCRLDVPQTEGLGFFLYEFGLSLPWDLPRAQYTDFMDKWTFRFVQMTGRDRVEYVHCPTSLIPVEPPPPVDLGWCGTLTGGLEGKNLYQMARATHLKPGTRWECWLAPSGKPAFVMPQVRLMLSGNFDEPRRSQMQRRVYMLAFEKVNVDRAQAIKLGLCDPTEPEETFEVPDSDRQYIIAQAREGAA